jgi:hypothetical protein
MLQLEITRLEMVCPFGPELRDEWDRTPNESIAKIYGTKKQGRK